MLRIVNPQMAWNVTVLARITPGRSAMNSGQSFLTICAFVVLSSLTLNLNTQLVDTGTTGLEMEATLDGISIAQSMLDEVLTKEFDEKTTGGARAFSAGDLTTTGGFGPDGYSQHITGVDSSRVGVFQSQTRFDDVDDYNSYTRKAWNPRFGWFDVSVRVTYANEDNANTAQSDRSFYKRVTVTVNHPNLVKDNNNNVVPLVVQDLAVYRRYF
jgi:hypothetical protein